MPVNNTTKYSVSSYQQFDGSNYTTVGIDNSYKIGDGNLGVYSGIGIGFDGKPAGAVIDFKGSLQYGESPVTGGFRIRNKLSEDSQSVQFRVQPATVTVPVAKNTNVYATPYVAATLNYGNGDVSTSAGAFVGVSQKIGDVSVFAEGQICDFSNINPSTTCFNFGIIVPIK